MSIQLCSRRTSARLLRTATAFNRSAINHLHSSSSLKGMSAIFYFLIFLNLPYRFSASVHRAHIAKSDTDKIRRHVTVAIHLWIVSQHVSSKIHTANLSPQRRTDALHSAFCRRPSPYFPPRPLAMPVQKRGRYKWSRLP